MGDLNIGLVSNRPGHFGRLPIPLYSGASDDTNACESNCMKSNLVTSIFIWMGSIEITTPSSTERTRSNMLIFMSKNCQWFGCSMRGYGPIDQLQAPAGSQLPRRV